jgi:hypothetical protein
MCSHVPLLCYLDSSHKPSIPMKQVSWHNRTMPRRSSKDVSQNALRVVEAAIGSPLKANKKTLAFPARQKNPAAVALGKLGGFKGGYARAAKLSAEERKAIAQRAAQARWAKRSKV